MNPIDLLIEAIRSAPKPTYPRACPNGGWDHPVIDGKLTDIYCEACDDVAYKAIVDAFIDYPQS